MPWLETGQSGLSDIYDEFFEDLGCEEEVSGMTVAQQLCETIPSPDVDVKHKGIAPSRGMHDCYSGGTFDTLFKAGDGRVGVPWGLRAAGNGGGTKNAKNSGNGSGGGDGSNESTQEGYPLLCDLISALWTKERQDTFHLGPQLIKKSSRSGS